MWDVMEYIGIGRHSGAPVCWLRCFITRLARVYGDYVMYIYIDGFINQLK